MTQCQSPPTAPPPTAQPKRSASADTAQVPRRLYRAPNTFLGGVATGLAGYFDVDPVITRLLFVVAFISGVGFPAYLVCWLVIPKAKSWPVEGYEIRNAAPSLLRLPNSIASGLLILALAAAVGTGLDGVADFLLPAGLLGFGVFLLNQQAPSTEPEFTSEPTKTDAQVELNQNNIITPTVLSLLALGLGLALALQAVGAVVLSTVTLCALGLGVVAVGLLASTRFGKAPGLVPVGVLLTAILVVTSAASPWVERWSDVTPQFVDAELKGHVPGGVMGVQEHAPQGLSELQTMYSHGMGELIVDLRALDMEGQTREVHAKLGFGELRVLVPLDLPVEVHGRVGVGESRGLLSSVGTSGANVLRPELGKLIVHYSVGFGEGSVRRER